MFHTVPFSVTVPQTTQELCSSVSSTDSWRRYGDEGDATEISVKPSLVLQTITDPDKLLQLWLQTGMRR